VAGDGQQLKCLTVSDEYTKEGLAIDVDGRIRSPRVIDVLSRLVSARGAPAFLRNLQVSAGGAFFQLTTMRRMLLSTILESCSMRPLVGEGRPRGSILRP
jgi:hypothetical protein